MKLPILLVSLVLINALGCATRPAPIEIDPGELTTQELYDAAIGSGPQAHYQLQPPAATPRVQPVAVVTVADPLYRTPARSRSPRIAPPVNDSPVIIGYRPGHYTQPDHVWIPGYEVQFPLYPHYVPARY